jgi:hypothetical protein
MTTRTCPGCGYAYTPKGDWQKICTQCWIAQKEADIADEAYTRGYAAGYAQGWGEARTTILPPAPIPDDILRDAIVLCHPDRHPGRMHNRALRTTTHLNQLRQTHA